MSSRRQAGRLLQELHRTIQASDTYRSGCTREAFAHDPLRRDATERCLLRARAVIAQLEDLGVLTGEAMSPGLLLLTSLDLEDALSPIDSDVLWSLAELCASELRVPCTGLS